MISNKLKSLPELKEIVLKLKSRNKKIITTNGVFDIIHVGHIRYLQKARALGDVLIVGTNNDSSVKRIKGESRPINSQENRAEVLSALESVDYVLIFNEDNPIKWLSEIKTDIHVKGGDYDISRIIERDVVESNGGKIVILENVHGISTSDIVRRIRGYREL